MNDETLFIEALKRPPEIRAAFLAQACGGDEKLRAAVEGLLRGHEQSGQLPAPPVDVSAEAIRIALGRIASQQIRRPDDR